MANIDPIKPINGKKLVIMCGVGAVLFTIVMGCGTYLLAQVMTPLLQNHAAKAPDHG